MPARRKRATRLSRKAAKLLALERVCRVATAGADGRPHLVPVCHVVAGQRIYFGSGTKGRKVENLRANPRLSLTVDCYAEDWAHIKGVTVQGKARLIARGPGFQRARARLYAKYPQYRKDAALATSDSLIVEVTPTHVYSWGLD
jgi:PPOX class probable F420-dependent enzyme